MTQEQKENLLREVEHLHQRHELAAAVGPDYFEPGRMEYLEQSDGRYDAAAGSLVIRFESRGTRYDGRTEQIEKVHLHDEVIVARDAANPYNRSNFLLLTKKGHDIRYSGGLFYAYTAEEDYAQGNMSESLYTGHVQNSHLQLEKKDCNGSSQQEVPCTNCGEYYVCSEQSPVSRCPFCGQLEEHGGATSETSSVDGSDGWRSYKFEVPLGVSFPQERVSEGKDWIDDCEINDTFCLDPACFYSKNQYDAALMLCKVCAGWYRYDTDEDRMEWIACLRSILTANSGEPMWYYDVWQKSFDWVASLRDCNPKYYGCFSDVDTLWELFSRLQQRSFLEKAECFSWFVQFFGENLRYNQRGSLSDCYVQNYDNHLEMILYLCPEQIDVLIRGDTAVTANGARHLARAAAGLIRLGKKEIGIHLYESVFQMVWEGKSTADEKKAVVDEFLIRLAAGYENEPYLDAEITELLEKQCSKYSDTKWTAKIRMMLAKTNEKS